MKETVEILKAAANLADGERAVLATVVDLKGSGYRLPGARMLIIAEGRTVGTVSGGCLEVDVLERSRRVIESGRAEVFKYDTTADENSVFSLNMGCRGVMRILIEPVSKDSEIIGELRRVRDSRTAVIAATAISSQMEALPVGTRFFGPTDSDGDKINSSHLPFQIPELEHDMRTLTGSRSTVSNIKYKIDKALVEFAFENLLPPVQLLIFGAGADAVPVAEAAHALGWRVCVSDHRPAYLEPARFECADELHTLDRDSQPQIDADPRTAIVSMNHNYDRDKAVIAAALASEAFYVGALGPKERTAQMIDELRESGEEIDEIAISRLWAPAGLDIGGDTPESIAISILGEIQSVLKHRSGGPLRERNTSIYDHK